jgi:hypothetical protein
VIRLDIVLREAVDAPYRDLVTRSTGAAVRNRVLAVLRGISGNDAELDFSQVGLMDYSCADEVVAKLLVETRTLPVFRVLLRGVHENHAEAIDHALARHDLVVVALLASPGRPQLLGAASEDWRAAFHTLDLLGRSAAPPVAERLEWSTARATDALEGLARLRCVLAHADATFELGAVA